MYALGLAWLLVKHPNMLMSRALNVTPGVSKPELLSIFRVGSTTVG